MHKKFNIAMIPSLENADAFIKYARDTFNVQPSEYSLGPNSYPHVTLCHFAAKDNDIDDIAKTVCALNIAAMQLTFATHRCKIYPDDSPWSQWAWISLMPDKLNELKELHLKIAEIVTPTNSAFDDYDPHLTLFNSRDKESCSRINLSPQANPALSSQFEIAIGNLDDVGQITEILQTCRK